MHPRRCRTVAGNIVGALYHTWVHYTTSCNTQSSAPEDGQNNFPKHFVLTGIINKLLLLPSSWLSVLFIFHYIF
jgi:hypothetical protein